MTTTATTTYPDDDRPVIIARHSHWCRIRWTSGEEEVVSVRTARRHGAIDQDQPEGQESE